MAESQSEMLKHQVSALTSRKALGSTGFPSLKSIKEQYTLLPAPYSISHEGLTVILWLLFYTGTFGNFW